jgi:two-component system sensor histidine kinase KdpD
VVTLLNRWLGASALARYASAVVASALATAGVLLLPGDLWLVSGTIVYLLAVLGVSIVAGRGPAIVASIGSLLAFDFFFIAPRFTLTIANPSEWIALLAFLAVAIVASWLTTEQREQYLEAEARARDARLLHDLTDLLAGPSFPTALEEVCERVRLELGADAVAVAVESGGAVTARAASGSEKARRSLQGLIGPATVLGSGQPATGTHSSAPGRWMRVAPPYPPGRRELPRNVARVPIRRGDEVIGDVRVQWASRAAVGAQQARLLDTVAGQVAVATERERLRAGAMEAEVLRRTSELKSAVLDAVSHDLRTPLAAIIAATGSMLQEDVDWLPEERREFLEAIAQESDRLDRIVGNLLDLSRIQGGVLVPARQWHDPTVVLRESLRRLSPATRGHQLVVDFPDDMEPILLDPVEIDQVVANLVENAAKHTPTGGQIRVSAASIDGELRVSVEDSGPGLPAEAIPRLFEPFYRAPQARAVRGSGLGLAVASGLVGAHGGRIWAENLNGHGARFSFAIPQGPMPEELAR